LLYFALCHSVFTFTSTRKKRRGLHRRVMYKNLSLAGLSCSSWYIAMIIIYLQDNSSLTSCRRCLIIQNRQKRDE